jgi:hypothetical protein
MGFQITPELGREITKELAIFDAARRAISRDQLIEATRSARVITPSYSMALFEGRQYRIASNTLDLHSHLWQSFNEERKSNGLRPVLSLATAQVFGLLTEPERKFTRLDLGYRMLQADIADTVHQLVDDGYTVLDPLCRVIDLS